MSYKNISGSIYLSNVKRKTKSNSFSYSFQAFDKTFPEIIQLVSKQNYYEKYKYDKTIFCIVNISIDKDENENTETIAHLVEIIGTSSNLEAVIKSKAYRHNLFTFQKLEKIGNTEIKFCLYEHCHDFRDKLIFSIDPENCVDIDDAIHIEEFPKYYEIGVHITDVFSILNQFDELCKNKILQEASNRFSTIYLLNEQIPILPKLLSHNLCSLLENQDRYAISCIFTYDKKENQFISTQVVQSLIQNKENMSYENANQNKCKKKELKKSLLLLKKLFNEKDTHVIVEKLMIHTNTEIASVLLHHSNSVLLRKQEKSFVETYPSLTFLMQNAAEYVEYVKSDAESDAESDEEKEKKEENYSHASLNVDTYTHFTSPIRRYPDLIVHSLYKNICSSPNHTILEINCNVLNQKQKQFKRFQRDIQIEKWLTQKYIELKEKHFTISTTCLFLPKKYSTKYEKYKTDLYFPKFNFFCSILIDEGQPHQCGKEIECFLQCSPFAKNEKQKIIPQLHSHL